MAVCIAKKYFVWMVNTTVIESVCTFNLFNELTATVLTHFMQSYLA